MTSPPTTRPLQSAIIQNIKYTGSATEFSASIAAQDVTIHCNSGTHNQGSSKIKLTDRIDYNWEMGYYPGQLVAAHISGKIIAYAIKGKEGGMVRVTNQETNQRALIKIAKNDIKDVAFAFSKQQIILGFVDEEGNVLIYEIIDEPKEIKYNLLLHIYHPHALNGSADTTSVGFRIIWCPYIMCFEDEEESCDDPEKMFVVLNGKKAEIWNVGIVNGKYGNKPINPSENCDGYVEIVHTAELVDASFSSDGTAIAIACADGYVKFFQIYMIDNEKQKCLHEWIPHEGKPISSIIFVDNLLESSSQCWKFTITGANHNSELKLWSCESWTCLQTIRFKPDPKSIIHNLVLKVCIDYTGHYLVISEMNNKVLYVLQLKRDDEAREIFVTMLSQFLLPTRFLSFYITEAHSRQLPFAYSHSNEDLYNADQDDYPDDDYDVDMVTSVFVKMLVIQQKKFQECNIVYQPDAILCNEASTTTYGEKKDFDTKLPKLDDLQSSVTLLIQQNNNIKQNLVTTASDTIISTVIIDNNSGQTTKKKKKASSDDGNDDNEDLLMVDDNDDDDDDEERNNLTDDDDDDDEVNLIDFQRPQKDNNNFASGGSSPSREVQEILSLNNSTTYSTQDYFDNSPVPSSQQIPQKDSNLLLYPAAAATAETSISNNNTSGLTATTTTTISTELIWPKIPIVNKDNEIIIKDDNINNNSLREELALKEIEFNKNQLKSINFRLTSLENSIQEETDLVRKIQQDVNAIIINNNNNNKLKTNDNTNNDVNKDDLCKELELAMSKQQLQIAKMLENLMNMQKTNEREQHDQTVANMSQIVNKSLTEKIHHVVANEMKHVVVPTIRSLVDALKQQLDMQNSQRISHDLIVRDNIASLLNSKNLVESLSGSVVKVITPSLEKCYRDMIVTTLVPTCEKVCDKMFQQINETFAQGTKEYTASVEGYMERQRNVQEKNKDMLVHIQNVSDTLKTSADKLNTTLSLEIQKQFNSSFKHMQDVLMHNVKETVAEQVKKGFKSHASVIEDSVINAVRSRAVTPSSHVDTQITLGHIDQVLAKENYDEAFKMALSAENLNYVIYLCEKVDVNTLFQKHCLQQHCLLALIQQLSIELSKNTEIKLSYIRAAFIALAPDYPHTKHFIPKVLKDLLKQLQYFMSTNPSSKYLPDAKLLKMAVEGMIDK